MIELDYQKLETTAISDNDARLERFIRYQARQLLSEHTQQEIVAGYDRVAFKAMLLFFGPELFLCVLFALSPQIATIGSDGYLFLLGSIGLGIASGVGLYSMLGIVHDASHGNVPKEARLARLINFITTPMLGVSNFTYRKAHLAHHAYLGQKEKDPQYAPFSPQPEHSSVPNYLLHDIQIDYSSLIRHVLFVAIEMSKVMMTRESMLLKSLFSKQARVELYRKYSFFGAHRSGLPADNFALPVRYRRRQKLLDWLRLGFQPFLLVLLFFRPLHYLSVLLLTAIAVAAVLNIARTTLEHSGHENKGDVNLFNRYHSSNTDGANILMRLIWYPVPWHAMHHVAPRLPFFLLGKLHVRVQNLWPDGSCHARTQ